MTTISIGHPVTFTLKPNEVTPIDLSSYDFDVPKYGLVGFKVNHDVYYLPDNPKVSLYTGFLMKPIWAGYISFPTDWLQEHILYMVSEEETTVTFEVVPNKQS